jgi:AraC-like DNA-binding protein
MPTFADSPQRVSFKTSVIAPSERADAYQALLTTLEASIDPATFAAEIDAYDLGPMLLLHTRVEDQTLRRAPQRIRRDGLASLLINVSRDGGDHGLAEERSMTVPAGGVAVSDNTREMTYAMRSREVFTLIVQREAIETRLGSANGLHGAVFDAGRSALFSDHVRWLASSLPGLPVEGALELACTTLDLFAATADASRTVLERTRDGVLAAAFARARRFIDANLTDPGLNPSSIARAAGLSRSALYRLFEPLGGVAAHVRRRRLEVARATLLDPTEARSLGELAHDLGFSSQALFSRLFREAFGYAPRELRGITSADAVHLDPRETAATYAALVRRLG